MLMVLTDTDLENISQRLVDGSLKTIPVPNLSYLKQLRLKMGIQFTLENILIDKLNLWCCC